MNNQNIFTSKQIEDSFIQLQSFILETQKKKVPFFIGRLSGVETNLCGIIINQLKVSDVIISQLLFNAGIKIKSQEDIFNYAKLYHNSVLKSNLLGVWDSSMYKQGELFYKYIDKFYPNIKTKISLSLI